MCVGVCVRVYVCMYVKVCVCVCMYVRVYVCEPSHTHIRCQILKLYVKNRFFKNKPVNFSVSFMNFIRPFGDFFLKSV